MDFSMNAPRVSIVIPANNEAESLADLLQEIANALAHESYEIIVVDDGSTDATREVLKPLSQQNQALRHLVHDRSCGKSAAILTGVRAARASLIATLDGDGQNDPRYLPALLHLAAEPNVGLAAGQRIKHAFASQADRLASRQPSARKIVTRRHPRYRLRAEGISARCLSPASLLCHHAPVFTCVGPA
jgi:glycosyltransferase involved in cell wall biosynthesis